MGRDWTESGVKNGAKQQKAGRTCGRQCTPPAQAAAAFSPPTHPSPWGQTDPSAATAWHALSRACSPPASSVQRPRHNI
eukprot:scaffold568083_cov16-Prasinocladus_malaysianus.AAC.1